MAKNKGMFNPKFKEKQAAQQASNKEFFKNNPGAYITGNRRVIPKPGDKRPQFAGVRKILQGQAKPVTPPSPLQTPGKPMGQAQPLQASPLSPEQPTQSPSIPFKESTIQQPEAPAPAQPAPIVPPSPAQPIPAPAAAPTLAPQVVSPAASMQAQKDQMFPSPAPAAPVAPKPPQVTPPAGVTKSQADIDEEKKKLQAAAGSPI